MTEKWNGQYFVLLANGNFKNKENGLIYTPRQLIAFLDVIREERSVNGVIIDFLCAENQDLLNKWLDAKNRYLPLYEENESRKSYQRVLEDKIRRLKDRIKVLEGHYGEGDKERLQAEGKARKDNFDRRVKW